MDPRRRLAHALRCLGASGDSEAPRAGSAVPGEGIDLIAAEGTKFEPGSGKLGNRTGSSALRVSLGASNGLVTSASPLASMAGTRVLLGGGNAFDAAVATAATLNVVEPMSSSIGGNGFSTVFDAATGAVHSLAMVHRQPVPSPTHPIGLLLRSNPHIACVERRRAPRHSASTPTPSRTTSFPWATRPPAPPATSADTWL